MVSPPDVRPSGPSGINKNAVQHTLASAAESDTLGLRVKDLNMCNAAMKFIGFECVGSASQHSGKPQSLHFSHFAGFYPFLFDVIPL